MENVAVHEESVTVESQQSRVKMIRNLLAGLICIGVLTAIVRGAINWCEYTDLFNLRTVKISGLAILKEKDVRALTQINLGSNLLRMDLRAIQNRLEKEPFIKAAIVSRDFPHTLQILIKERQPVAYLNVKSLFLIDGEGVVLPLPAEKLADIYPVITGFEADSGRVHPGRPTTNSDILTAIGIIELAASRLPAVYAEISELYRWHNNEFVIYTVNGGTPIYLGNREHFKRLFILNQFQTVIQNKRTMADYRYLDLRWNKQIIVRERNS